MIADRSLAPSRSSGFFITFFPIWALFEYWAYLDHKTHIHEVLLRYWRRVEDQGKTKPNSGGSDFLPARSRRQTFDKPRAPLPARSRSQINSGSSAHHSTD